MYYPDQGIETSLSYNNEGYGVHSSSKVEYGTKSMSMEVNMGINIPVKPIIAIFHHHVV